MTRGAVYWIDFSLAQGGEIRNRRPAVVVSNDRSNRVLNRLQVVPITSNVRRMYPWEAPVQVAGRPGKALADQLQTVAKEKLLNYIGDVTLAEMRGIERAIRLQLGLV